MSSDCEKRKITDLRVVDLKAELDKRGLDKTGVKALLIERLQGVNLHCIFMLFGTPFCTHEMCILSTCDMK